MKKKIVFGICVFILSAVFMSCEKEPVTDIAKIEKELKSVIKENGITKCNIVLLYGEKTYREHRSADFSIKGGFLAVDSDRYNLLYLSKYEINYEITFYFANTHY